MSKVEKQSPASKRPKNHKLVVSYIVKTPDHFSIYDENFTHFMMNEETDHKAIVNGQLKAVKYGFAHYAIVRIARYLDLDNPRELYPHIEFTTLLEV